MIDISKMSKAHVKTRLNHMIIELTDIMQDISYKRDTTEQNIEQIQANCYLLGSEVRLLAQFITNILE